MERKYKSIFESIDTGNVKKALQECDKALKKLDSKKQDKIDVKFLRALKCLVFSRSGRKEEAQELLTSLLADHPTDTDILQVLQTALKEMRMYDTLIEMYETAAKANPSEDVLTSLFMACVINGDYRRQQQVATKLHQAFPDRNQYYFWSVASIVLQAIDNPKMGKSLFLPLAEKLCNKYIQENKIEAETEIILYLDILARMERYDDAIKLLKESPLVKALDEIDYRLTRLAEFLYWKKSWEECYESYKKLLDNNPNQWLFWERLIRCAIELGSENVADTLDFIQTVESGGKCEARAVLLAPFMFLQQKANTTLNVKELFQSYLKKYGSKPCAMDDLKEYLGLISISELEEIVKTRVDRHIFFKAGKSLGNGTTEKSQSSGPQVIDELTEILNLYGMILHKRADLSTEKLKQYIDLLSQCSKDFDEVAVGTCANAGDNKPGDGLVILIASYQLEIYRRTLDLDIIYQVGDLLLKLPENNYHRQLLLIICMNTLGAGAQGFMNFMKLEIKNIQHETLGYLTLGSSGGTGALSHYFAILDGCLRQANMACADFSHSLPLTYHFGTFIKIPEMIELQKKLKSSVDFCQVSVEKMLMDLLVTPVEVVTSVANDLLENLKDFGVQWDETVLLRDYKPIGTCNFNIPDEEASKKLLALQILKLKCSISEAKLIAISISLPNTTDVTNLSTEMIRFANDFVDEEKKIRGELIKTMWPIVPLFHYWPWTDLETFSDRCVLVASVTKLGAKIISTLSAVDNGSTKTETMAAELALLADVENQLKNLVGTLKKDCPSSENEINTTLRVFALVKLFCEISLCLVVPVERMRHIKSHLVKIMKKKKEQVNLDMSFFGAFDAFVAFFYSSIEKCSVFCNELDENFKSCSSQENNTFKDLVLDSYRSQMQQCSERLSHLSKLELTIN